MSDENLAKLHIDLPNHWAIGGESMWATPLGNDLYRIENVPFFAYGLNFLDIVLAKSESEDLIPEICSVVTPSGHRTYRIMFDKKLNRDKQVELLASLEQKGVSMIFLSKKPNKLFNSGQNSVGWFRSASDYRQQNFAH